MTDFSRLAPGFADYPDSSRRVFRLALDGLSRPCRVLELAKGLTPAEAPLPPVPAALALTLLDALTPVWLSPSWRRAEGWLRFHRGCPVCEEPERAAFVLAASLAELPPLASLNPGLPRFPDASATVILGAALDPEDRRPLTAEGPGLDGPVVFRGHRLDEKFLEAWRGNRGGYPLGVDFFLTGGTGLAGLPRSVSLKNPGAEGGPSCM